MNNDYMQFNGSSLYGNYRSRTFSDIFESAENFIENWNQTPFPAALLDLSPKTSQGEPIEKPLDISLIFYLLYSRYGNSTIASSDENRFKFQLFEKIFQYAPSWKKRLEMQAEIRALTTEELREGNRVTVNMANNPSTVPSTVDTEELPYVNAQNVNKTKKSTAEAYAILTELLKTDVTDEFLSKFKKLFLTIVQPELPLWYETVLNNSI